MKSVQLAHCHKALLWLSCADALVTSVEHMFMFVAVLLC